MHRTTIALSSATRDRLLHYGRKGDSYEEILISLMDAAAPSGGRDPTHHARDWGSREVAIWQRKTASEKLAIAEDLRALAYRTNPEGVEAGLKQRMRTGRR